MRIVALYYVSNEDHVLSVPSYNMCDVGHLVHDLCYMLHDAGTATDNCHRDVPENSLVAAVSQISCTPFCTFPLISARA